MDNVTKEFVIIRVDDDVELKLSVKKFEEFNNNNKAMIFDFRDRSVVIMNVPAFKKGE